MPSVMKWAIALLIGFGLIAAGWKWAPWLLTTFFILNCFVLIVVVLLQSGKAADLAGAFGGAGSQTAFGPRGAANVLSRATTWCAIMFMVCAMALVLRQDKAIARAARSSKKFRSPSRRLRRPLRARLSSPQRSLDRNRQPRSPRLRRADRKTRR